MSATYPTISYESLPANGRIIALDHGSKTIGVAISDASQILASPLLTIERSKFATDSNILIDLANKHQPVAIIVGYPQHMDGSEGPRCQSVRAFIRQMEPLIPCPIIRWDERLSSSAAEDAMIEAGRRYEARATRIDAAAAAMILQSFLEHLARIR